MFLLLKIVFLIFGRLQPNRLFVDADNLDRGMYQKLIDSKSSEVDVISSHISGNRIKKFLYGYSIQVVNVAKIFSAVLSDETLKIAFAWNKAYRTILEAIVAFSLLLLLGLFILSTIQISFLLSVFITLNMILCLLLIGYLILCLCNVNIFLGRIYNQIKQEVLSCEDNSVISIWRLLIN